MNPVNPVVAPTIVRWARWAATDGALAPDLLAPAMRRRVSRLTRMATHVVTRLLADDTALLQRSALVFASALGEVDTSLELLRLLQSHETSALRFTNSVHNAALGALTIAAEHRGVATAVSAGDQTVAMGWLEACALLATHASVVVVFADLELGPPLPVEHAYDALAVGFLLVNAEKVASGGVRASLPVRSSSSSRVRDHREGEHSARFATLARVPAGLTHNPCAPAWSLSEACVRPPALVPLATGTDPWVVQLERG